VSGAAELGRECLPQPDLLPPGREGQSLRGLAGAGALHVGGPRRTPLPAL